MKKIGLFAAGVLFGTAGMKLLGSKDAKRAYAQPPLPPCGQRTA